MEIGDQQKIDVSIAVMVVQYWFFATTNSDGNPIWTVRFEFVKAVKPKN